MLSIARCRSILGPQFETLSDEDVHDLRDQLYAIARLAILSHAPEENDRSNALETTLPEDLN